MSDIRSGAGAWHALDTGLAEGVREFVVGDVHGHGFELGELLVSMRNACGDSAANANLTFLGDLIDRGPCSVGTVRLAGAAEAKFGFGSVNMVLGNHEIMMIASMGLVRGTTENDVLSAWQLWNANGGERVLEEIEERLPGRFPVNTPREFRTLMQDAFTPQGLGFILSGDTHRRAGRLLLCHSGVDRDVTSLPDWFSTSPWPIESEDANWAWARKNSWGHEGGWPEDVVVVHGHTPELHILKTKGRISELKDRWGAPIPVDIARVAGLDGNRIGLDGGSFATGVVMGAEFTREGYRLHFAWNPDMLLDGRLIVGATQLPDNSVPALSYSAA